MGPQGLELLPHGGGVEEVFKGLAIPLEGSRTRGDDTLDDFSGMFEEKCFLTFQVDPFETGSFQFIHQPSPANVASNVLPSRLHQEIRALPVSTIGAPAASG